MKKIFLIAVCLLLLFAGPETSGAGCLKITADDLPVQIKTTLVVQSGIYYGAEDEEQEPVETDFYLLDESLITILKRAKFKPVFTDGKKHSVKDEDYLEAAAKVLLSQTGDGEAEILAYLINEAIERHQASFAHTKSTGRGYFKTIKAGNYFLFGIKQIEDQIVVWHLPVVVKPGGNAVELDQNNAAAVFSSGG